MGDNRYQSFVKEIARFADRFLSLLLPYSDARQIDYSIFYAAEGDSHSCSGSSSSSSGSGSGGGSSSKRKAKSIGDSKRSGCVGSSRAKAATTGGGKSSNGNENAVRESREKAVGGNANGAMSEYCLLPYLGEESQLNSVSHFQQRRSQPISRKRKAEAAAAVATTAAGRCDSRNNGGVSWQLQRNWRQWR